MADRPVIFSAPMVRAVLAGTKTQTRRVVKNAPADWSPVGPETFSPIVVDRRGDERPGPDAYGAGNEDGSDWIRCPYGQPGDRLWVREAFRQVDGQTQAWIETDYRATYKHGDRMADHLGIERRWSPAIHMPRHASRITLEIAGIRVERLQAISADDARAEGIVPAYGGFGLPDGSHFHASDPRESYLSLFEAINGPGSVEADPWVWVVTFRRIKGG